MNDWVDAERRIELAQELCESRRYEEALEQVEGALQINGNNAGWWNSKGYLLDQLERFEEAIEAYNASLELEPDNCEVLTALGVDHVKTAQLLSALDTFEYLSRLYPDFEPAYCHRIMLYSELGQHDLAEEMFYHAQVIDENCPHCFWHLGCSLWAREEVKRAIYCWQRVLQIEPNYCGARKRIAEAYRVSRDLNTAREYYLAEYRQDPGNTDLLLELGEMYVEDAQWEAAAGKFRQVIELDPYHTRALVMLGDVLQKTDQYDEALRAYRDAAESDDAYPAVHYKLGVALMDMGQHRAARESLQAELSVRPHDRSTLMAAGNCALELGEPDLAQEYFRRLINVDDSLPGAYHNLGVCHFLRREYEEGIERCEQALALKDDYILARHKLVLAHMYLGHWSEARHMLHESLQLDPNNPALRRLKRRLPYQRLARLAQRVRETITGH